MWTPDIVAGMSLIVTFLELLSLSIHLFVNVARGLFRIQFVKGRKSKVSSGIVNIINSRRSLSWRGN